jgi:restriction endonuclease S subunit
MTPLGTVAEVSTGYPFRKKVETEEGGDIVLVQIKDLGGAEGVKVSGSVMLRNQQGKYERYLLRTGDLLFQSRGSRYPVAIVGQQIRGIAAAGLHVIRPNPERVLAQYLAWWLSHPNSQAKIRDDLSRGTYIPFVSKRELEGFLVPVPSLEVQRRIVEVDELRAREQHLRQRLGELTQQLVDGVTLAATTSKHSRK